METVRELYEQDFFAWTRHQARELKRLKALHLNTELDLDHLVEEVRDLGSDQRDACRSQVERILEHFLKLRCSPAEGPRAGWKRSVVEARSALDKKLSTSLKNDLRRQLPRLFVHARRAAVLGLEEHGEFAAAKRLPDACPFTLDEVLRDDWYPEPLALPPAAD